MNRVLVVGSLAIVSCLVATSRNDPARADAPSGQSIRIAVTKSACDPDALTAAAGAANFVIHNATAQPVEWEILDGIMVVDEQENIPAGGTRTLATHLSPGDYQITCGLISNPKGTLHVDAAVGAPPRISPTALIGPLAEYRVYALGEIEGLANDMQRLADALKSGDIASARALYATAHAHYARIAPIALFFPDLDGGDDPQDAGFRRLALSLAANGDPTTGAVADKLVADVAAMQSRFEDLPLTPAPTFVGAVQSIGGAAAAALGATEPLSNADFADLQGYLEGAGKIVELFQPLIEKSDKSLSLALTQDFSQISATLAKYQPGDQAFDRKVRLSPEDRALLQRLLKRTASELGQISSTLGVG